MPVKNMLSPQELIVALASLPAQEFAQVLSAALAQRESDPVRLHTDDARHRLVQEPGEAGETLFTQEFVAQARRQVTNVGMSHSGPLSTLGGCCGLMFSSHAKKVICPLCGRQASAL